MLSWPPPLSHNVWVYTMSFKLRSSLVSRPSRTCEKGGTGVLSDFSCHIGRGSSPILELKSDLEHIIICAWHKIIFWTELKIEKTYLAACSQLSQETLWPYQAFVSHSSLSRRKSWVPDVKCNYDILYAVGPTPCDKKCCSEHQTPFSLLGGWSRDSARTSLYSMSRCRQCQRNWDAGCSTASMNHCFMVASFREQLHR